MFNHCIFKVSVDLRHWFKAAGVRAIKTMAQSAIGVIGSSAVLGMVDWRMIGSAAVLAGIVSLLTSVAGLPEVAPKTTEESKAVAAEESEETEVAAAVAKVAESQEEVPNHE